MLRIAVYLAARMDYDTGHARYCLDRAAAELGLDRATVKRHVARLREAGLLAWVVQGSRQNVRRLLGLPGYAATATVYAAVIPPAYDQAHGNQVLGTGYTARLLTPGQQQAPVDNPPVDNPDAPPSLTVVKEEGKVKVEGGLEDTPRTRARRPKHSSPRTSSSAAGPRRTPAQVARDCWIAARVRPLVGWTQAEGIRRLAFALRPLIDRGLDAHDIADELSSWYLTWRPARPAAYIRAHLQQQTVQPLLLPQEQTTDPLTHPAWSAWIARRNREQQVMATLVGTGPSPARRPVLIRQAQADPRIVLDYLDEHGADAALDLYGARLTALAVRLRASTSVTLTCRW